jgi:anti-sigma regulatory factor (Ser/Thr protein kinase)
MALIAQTATARAFTVADATQVGEARRGATAVAAAAGLGEVDAGRVALVASEAASNVARHGGGGMLHVRALTGCRGVEVVAWDRGPGMGDVERALRDGYSTGGTAGTGLGAMRRLADDFDMYTAPGQGVALMARIRQRSGGGLGAAAPAVEARDLEIGAVVLAAPGEPHPGDAWVVLQGARGPAIAVIDGLGHGPAAHEAAQAVLAGCHAASGSGPAAMLASAHTAARPTRGAAVAVLEVDADGATVRLAGIGNIACAVLMPDGGMRHLPSMQGIVGGEMRRVHEVDAPMPRGALLIAHSDGVATRWRLTAYPGLADRHPALVAAVLLRDFIRGRDDATVVVARRTS